MKIETERTIADGWWVERFAREKMLNPLRTYLPGEHQRGTAQSEMLAHLRGLKAQGKSIRIRKVAK